MTVEGEELCEARSSIDNIPLTSSSAPSEHKLRDASPPPPNTTITESNGVLTAIQATGVIYQWRTCTDNDIPGATQQSNQKSRRDGDVDGDTNDGNDDDNNGDDGGGIEGNGGDDDDDDYYDNEDDG